MNKGWSVFLFFFFPLYFPIFLNLIPLKGKQFVLKGKVADRDHSFLRIIALFFFTVLPQSNSLFNALYLISFTLDFFESVKVLCDTKCKRNIQVSSENSLPTNSPNSPSTPTCPSSGDIILESSFLPNGRLVTNSTSWFLHLTTYRVATSKVC